MGVPAGKADDVRVFFQTASALDFGDPVALQACRMRGPFGRTTSSHLVYSVVHLVSRHRGPVLGLARGQSFRSGLLAWVVLSQFPDED